MRSAKDKKDGKLILSSVAKFGIGVWMLHCASEIESESVGREKIDLNRVKSKFVCMDLRELELAPKLDNPEQARRIKVL